MISTGRSIGSPASFKKFAPWLVMATLTLSWVSIALSTWRPAPAIDRWTVADWLINYADGPIRRGLFGELVSRFASDSQSASTVVIVSQLVLLAVAYAAAFLLFLGTPRSPAWVAVVLSPAFLMFPLLSYQGGLRKELLILTSLALLALVVTRAKHAGLVIVPLALYSLAAFSHESAGLSLTPFLFLIVLGLRRGFLSRGSAVVFGLLWATVSVSSLVFAWANPGSVGQANYVCQFWLDRGSSEEACAGAIGAVGGTLSDALTEVLARYPEYFAYLPLALLALTPLMAVRVNRALWILVGVLYLSLLPLFLAAIDYGRWIYLATSLVSICALAMAKNAKDLAMRVPPWAAAAFILGWSLPYTGPVIQEPLFGKLVWNTYEALIQRFG